MSLQTRKTSIAIQTMLIVLLITVSGCKSTKEESIKTFATPEEAGKALQAAATADDEAALTMIFGPDSKEVISSGDPVQDKNTAAKFSSAYDVMHRWRRMEDSSQILLVGYDNFPFPIPLKKSLDGKWFFDTAAGKQEILNRRVGQNELAIIDVCNAVANAQIRYFAESHDGSTKRYAMKFISEPGTHNGLYWDSPAGQPQSPLGPLAAFATAEGYKAKPDAHVPFHGYYFHMLKGQTDKAPGGAKEYVVNGKMTGGFAFVAYPAEYGNSGVMTFIIDQDGVLLQKDLGKNTGEVAKAMTEFDPDSGWSIVEE
jgi:Protein of unknown function (DUF2950)